MNILKNRLKIKRLSIKIEEAIEWNFGYCPSDDEVFDKWIEERLELQKEMQETDKEWVKVYEDYLYGDFTHGPKNFRYTNYAGRTLQTRQER